jgi:hypothetical protein
MPYRLTRPVSSSSFQTTQTIREAVEDLYKNNRDEDLPQRGEGLPPLQVVTVDHYNSKWAVAAIEWLQRRHIVDHILKKQPKRICIQVLEGGMLPSGRFLFYNGVGGALADMIAHLIQPLRALSGLATVKDLLAVLSIIEVRRARYNLSDELLFDAFSAGTVEKGDLSSKLGKETETFGIIKLKFTGSPWPGTHVYIRTGKGFIPASKQIIVEGEDSDGSVALICDLDKRHILLADRGPKGMNRQAEENGLMNAKSLNRLPDHAWMQTREFDVPGLISSRPLGPRADEYVEIFSALCNWESPDPRFFPSVDDATQVCDFFYREILRDRSNHAQGLVGSNVYEADYVAEEVRGWMAGEAGWY